MSEYVLDASALLALLNEEPGADEVQAFLSRAAISSVNLAEVVSRLASAGIPEGEIRGVLSLLGIEVLPFDEEAAFQTGLLYLDTRSTCLSQGDRACLVTARMGSAAAVTADRAWQNLDVGLEIKLVR